MIEIVVATIFGLGTLFAVAGVVDTLRPSRRRRSDGKFAPNLTTQLEAFLYMMGWLVLLIGAVVVFFWFF